MLGELWVSTIGNGYVCIDAVIVDAPRLWWDGVGAAGTFSFTGFVCVHSIWYHSSKLECWYPAERAGRWGTTSALLMTRYVSGRNLE